MSTKRLEIEDYLSHDAELEGSLDSLLDSIVHWKEQIAEKGGIEGSGYVDYEYYGYDGGRDIVIKYRRLETDKEYDARLKQAERIRENKRKAKAKKDASDRKTYERLKKKFEGK